MQELSGNNPSLVFEVLTAGKLFKRRNTKPGCSIRKRKNYKYTSLDSYLWNLVEYILRNYMII